MNKKIVLTLSCLMAVQGASALSFSSAWNSVANMFKSAQPQATSVWNSVQGGWTGFVDKYQVASAISSPVLDGYGWVKKNPVGTAVTAFSAGSYPKFVIPALGGIATWYATKQLDKKRSWNLTDSKKLGSAAAGTLATFAFMHKPKLTTVGLALAAIAAYKKGWGPFAKNNCPGGVCPVPANSAASTSTQS